MVEMAPEKMIAGRSRLAGNAVSLAVSGAAGVIFTLIQLSILSRSLEGELFGVFVVLRGFSLLLSTIILVGLPQMLIRFLPSFQSRGEEAKALRLFLASSAVVLFLGVLMYLGVGAVKGLVPATAEDFLSEDVLSWMVLASIAIALKLILYGGFTGLREMRFQMMFELGYLVILTFFILLFRLRLDLLILFKLICILNGIIFVPGATVFVVSVYRSTGPEKRHVVEGVVLPSFFPYLGYSLILGFVALAFSDFDRFVMSSVLSFSAISIFHIASRVNSLIKRFLAFPVIALQPEVTRIYEEGRWEELSEKIVLFTKTTVIAAFFFVMLAAVAGRGVIILLSGRAYIGAYPILLVLLTGIPIAAFAAPLLATMKGLDHIKWAVLCDFLWMAVYFGSFMIFVSIWGVLGMAVAQVLASAVQMLVAVMLSKREGFYGRPGSETGKAILLFLFLILAGVLLTEYFGLPATIAWLLMSPFVLKFILVRLEVFNQAEAGKLIGMVPAMMGKKALAWFLAAEV